MTIYSKFKPTRLYIKSIERVDGSVIKYFGKSTAEDIFSYTGSGKIWRDYIKKYGKHSIKTEWVSEWFYDKNILQEFALKFSSDNNIIESSLWANMKLENGLDGGLVSEESKKILSKKQLGRKTKGTSGKIWITNGIYQLCVNHDYIIPEGWFKGRAPGKCGKLFSKNYQPRYSR